MRRRFFSTLLLSCLWALDRFRVCALVFCNPVPVSPASSGPTLSIRFPSCPGALVRCLPSPCIRDPRHLKSRSPWRVPRSSSLTDHARPRALDRFRAGAPRTLDRCRPFFLHPRHVNGHSEWRQELRTTLKSAACDTACATLKALHTTPESRRAKAQLLPTSPQPHMNSDFSPSIASDTRMIHH